MFKKIHLISLILICLLILSYFLVSHQQFPEKPNKSIQPFEKAYQAMEFFIDKRIAKGEKSLNIDKYRIADAHLSKMQKSPFKKSNAWQLLGPNNIGGRTRKLVIDSNAPNIMFAAAASGGVWKTIDGGQNWTTSFTSYANLATNALAMDPYDSQILYAGTGEGYFGFDNILGDGIYKTINGGQSWSHLDSPIINNATVNDLVISKVNSNIIYAATAFGVLKSDDAGQTWMNVLFTSDNGGCLDLEIKDSNSIDYLFVSCGTLGEANVYRNLDAVAKPNTWESVLPIDPNRGRTTLAIAPSNQDVVYALSASNESDLDKKHGLYKVYKSTTSGSLWYSVVDNTTLDKPSRALLSEPIQTSYVECGFGSQNYYSNQGWHNNSITVDPLDENKIWAGGVALFRSDDGGYSWGEASYWPGTNSSHYVHADTHSIVFHPNYNANSNSTLFVANDGGVFKTNNANDSVATTNNAFPDSPLCGPFYIDINWQSLNNGYAVTQFNHGAVFPGGDKYWGGTQDNGFLLGSQTTGLEWQRVSGGDGSHVEVNQDNTDIMYANGPGMNFKKSLDGGVSFQSATNGFIDFAALFVNPFALDPNNQNRLWIASSKFIYRSDDAATTWNRVNSNELDILGSALAVSPLNSNLVLIGTASGDIHKSINATTADEFTTWSVNRPRNGHVSSIVFNPNNDNEVIASYSTLNGGGHIWRSTNAGETWDSIDGEGLNSIPNIPVLSLAYNSLNTDILFAGTDLGVLISYDSGENWSQANAGVLPKTPVEHLTFVNNPQFTGLYVFTYGRSVYRLAVDADFADLIFSNGFESN